MIIFYNTNNNITIILHFIVPYVCDRKRTNVTNSTTPDRQSGTSVVADANRRIQKVDVAHTGRVLFHVQTAVRGVHGTGLYE